jgi:hypothetical protein
MERLTTDTARAVAAFLYDRDSDMRQAAELTPDAEAYRRFLAHRSRTLHGTVVGSCPRIRSAGSPSSRDCDARLAADPRQALADNAKAFSARPPEFSAFPNSARCSWR